MMASAEDLLRRHQYRGLSAYHEQAGDPCCVEGEQAPSQASMSVNVYVVFEEGVVHTFADCACLVPHPPWV